MNNEMILVARYSDDIHADIERNFSCYQHYELGSSYEGCQRDAEEMRIANPDIRPLPGGGYGIVHHEGLSCYGLEAQTVEDAVLEATSDALIDGSGYAQVTVGAIELLRTIPADEAGSIRDLHILAVRDVENEEF